MIGNAKRKPMWEELATADEPFELDADLDFLEPTHAQNVPAPASPGDFDAADRTMRDIDPIGT